ncbi:DUF4395 domain-containing protein [Salsuginibacillus kocurii]|uniref:DUF4395 domain-containing protein n=1 Tax=Salsuginibacillus kocurii TaxID=427078 RepID=UPI0003616B09|nr:DUF4395 domain-containing protein [Salsuginibacillus kocurii]
MEEIPKPLVQANQLFLVAATSLAIIFQIPELLAFTFLVIILPIYFGPRANLIFKVTKPFLQHKFKDAETEHVKLQRFNQSIAAIMIGLAVFTLFLLGHWVGYIFAGMVTVAAITALSGYCVGCVIYYQWRQFRYKANKS